VLCYEAGYDAFWLARFLKARGIECLVVDAASLQVNRRARRAKTDRIDVGMLLRALIKWVQGDRHVWSVVRVPSVERRPLSVWDVCDGRRLKTFTVRDIPRPFECAGNCYNVQFKSCQRACRSPVPLKGSVGARGGRHLEI
jgi:hypothetical protein